MLFTFVQLTLTVISHRSGLFATHRRLVAVVLHHEEPGRVDGERPDPPPAQERAAAQAGGQQQHGDAEDDAQGPRSTATNQLRLNGSDNDNDNNDNNDNDSLRNQTLLN